MKQKIKAVNALHNWINEVVPQLNKILAAGYKRKKDGDFYNANKGPLSAILAGAPYRAWIDTRHKGLTLRADTHYPDGGRTAYHSRNILLEAPFPPLKIYHASTVAEARRQKAMLEHKIRDIQNQINALDTLED